MKRRAPVEVTAPHGEWRSTSTEASSFSIPRHRYTDLNRLALKFRLGSFTAEMLSWGFIDGARWWRNYLHTHTHYEICYAFCGKGSFRMLGKDYSVGKGDVFIAKPGEEHEIIANEADPLGIYFWSYTLVQDGRTLRPGAAAMVQAQQKADAQGLADHQPEPLDRLLHAYVDSTCWVSARVPGMERTLELLTEEIVRGEPGYVKAVEGLASKLILDTARAGAGAPMPGEDIAPIAKGPGQSCVAQALRYMRDNLGRNLAMREVAEQANMSERHFSRVFRQASGQSPLDALTEIRIETAAQLLLDQMLPIKEIAERTGFPDVRYFTTVFRKHKGSPPAAFRKRGGTRFVDPDRESRRLPGHVVARKAKPRA